MVERAGRKWFAAVVALALCAGLLLAQTRSPAYRFQQAIDLMETKGDYQAAIRLFEEITKTSDRNLAARSLLYLGLCYEKLAKDKAPQAYQRILREFADQREVVAEARARLSALGGTAAGSASAMVSRRVWESADTMGGPSPDGRYLSFVDWETGDLAVRDLTAGVNRRLTNNGSSFDPSEYAEFSTISPGGKEVVYAWFSKDERYELRIVPLEGSPGSSRPRVVYGNENQEVVWLRPADWSPDGKQILALFRGKDGANRIVLVSVNDGSVRVLKTLDWRYPQNMCFSPDGRYIVYDFPAKDDMPERDVFVLAADGTREIPVVQHPANDFVLGWAPDGKRIVFASDRTETLSAWVISFADGKPLGSPELVKQDLGRIIPMRFTRKGSYYYGLSTQVGNIYVATLDPTTGKVLSPPTPVNPRFIGSQHWPEWSPDGKFLAYVSRLGLGGSAGGAPLSLTISSLENGAQRALFPRLNYFSRLRWFPDGRFILANGLDHANRGGLYRIDVQTGEVTALVRSAPGSGYPRQAAWSPDGKSIFYSHVPGPIWFRDLETGREKQIYPGVVFALSPDGRWLAVYSEDQAAKVSVLKLVPAAGGEARELLRLPEPGAFLNLAWSADGRYLLFGRNGLMRDHPEKTELWRISVQGGEPERLGLSVDRMVEPRVHPDGQRIAFTAGQWKAEVWVMENFLPVIRASR